MCKPCRTKYLGEWSAACIMGLLTGLVILIMQRYMSADAVHQLLTFNPADFFTCGQASLCRPARFQARPEPLARSYQRTACM